MLEDSQMYALPLIVMGPVAAPTFSGPCIASSPDDRGPSAPWQRRGIAAWPANGSDIAYLHYSSIILLAGFLVGELASCRAGHETEQARRLAGIDAVFFASALAALATGLLRLFLRQGRQLLHRHGQPTFWVKMALYVIIAAISIEPTRTFLRWKRAAASAAPRPPATRSPPPGA